MRNHYFISFLSCILLITLLGGCGKKDPAAGSENNPAPESNVSSDGEADTASAPVSFETLTLDGNTLSADLFSESRITMINVWATYCNPCFNEMPGLGELASSYNPGDFQLIGIISDVMEDADEETLTHAADLVAETGADYPHLLLSESLYYALLTDVSAVPTTFFVDQDGQILDTVIGAMEKSAWEEKINALLEE